MSACMMLAPIHVCDVVSALAESMVEGAGSESIHACDVKASFSGGLVIFITDIVIARGSIVGMLDCTKCRTNPNSTPTHALTLPYP
jgi:hypothetical protein